MGYELVSMEVHACMSRHNSEQDKVDDAIWEQLRKDIQAAVEKANEANPRILASAW